MSDPLKMFRLQIYATTHNAIFSQASESGVGPYVKPDGRMIAVFGQAVAHASLSALLEKEQEQQTTATCGPSGSISSASASLSSALGNRLKAQLGTAGSTLYRQTWREKATPLGRLYSAHIASPLHTRDNGCTSWPTPNAGDANPRSLNCWKIPAKGQVHAQQLAAWITPNVIDAHDGTKAWCVVRFGSGEVI